MLTTITVEENINLVKVYYKLDENTGNVQRELYEEDVKSGKFYPKLGSKNKRDNLPSLQTIRYFISAFYETGCVDNMLFKAKTRTKTVTGVAENIQ